MLRFRSCSCRQRDERSDLRTPGSERSEAAQVVMVCARTDSFLKGFEFAGESWGNSLEASVHVCMHVSQRTSVSINMSAENKCF